MAAHCTRRFIDLVLIRIPGSARPLLHATGTHITSPSFQPQQMGDSPHLDERRFRRAALLQGTMARQARLVASNVVHHAVARGVDRKLIFRSGYDKGRYLKRMAAIAQQEDVQVHGYCLMPNHVHLLLTPARPDGLSRFFKRLHTWWAGYYNRKYGRTGHLFQGRYSSSSLSECHYWTALRYVEMNAVRAKMVDTPEAWVWSSARHHMGIQANRLVPLMPVPSRRSVTNQQWREILNVSSEEDDQRLRKAHKSSQPCGPPSFVKQFRHPRSLSLLHAASNRIFERI